MHGVYIRELKVGTAAPTPAIFRVRSRGRSHAAFALIAVATLWLLFRSLDGVWIEKKRSTGGKLGRRIMCLKPSKTSAFTQQKRILPRRQTAMMGFHLKSDGVGWRCGPVFHWRRLQRHNLCIQSLGGKSPKMNHDYIADDSWEKDSTDSKVNLCGLGKVSIRLGFEETIESDALSAGRGSNSSNNVLAKVWKAMITRGYSIDDIVADDRLLRQVLQDAEIDASLFVDTLGERLAARIESQTERIGNPELLQISKQLGGARCRSHRLFAALRDQLVERAAQRNLTAPQLIGLSQTVSNAGMMTPQIRDHVAESVAFVCPSASVFELANLMLRFSQASILTTSSVKSILAQHVLPKLLADGDSIDKPGGSSSGGREVVSLVQFPALFSKLSQAIELVMAREDGTQQEEEEEEDDNDDTKRSLLPALLGQLTQLSQQLFRRKTRAEARKLYSWGGQSGFALERLLDTLANMQEQRFAPSSPLSIAMKQGLSEAMSTPTASLKQHERLLQQQQEQEDRNLQHIKVIDEPCPSPPPPLPLSSSPPPQSKLLPGPKQLAKLAVQASLIGVLSPPLELFILSHSLPAIDEMDVHLVADTAMQMSLSGMARHKELMWRLEAKIQLGLNEGAFRMWARSPMGTRRALATAGKLALAGMSNESLFKDILNVVPSSERQAQAAGLIRAELEAVREIQEGTFGCIRALPQLLLWRFSRQIPKPPQTTKRGEVVAPLHHPAYADKVEEDGSEPSLPLPRPLDLRTLFSPEHSSDKNNDSVDSTDFGVGIDLGCGFGSFVLGMAAQTQGAGVSAATTERSKTSQQVQDGGSEEPTLSLSSSVLEPYYFSNINSGQMKWIGVDCHPILIQRASGVASYLSLSNCTSFHLEDAFSFLDRVLLYKNRQQQQQQQQRAVEVALISIHFPTPFSYPSEAMAETAEINMRGVREAVGGNSQFGSEEDFLIRPQLVDKIAKALKEGGYFYSQTNAADVALRIWKQFNAHKDFRPAVAATPMSSNATISRKEGDTRMERSQKRKGLTLRDQRFLTRNTQQEEDLLSQLANAPRFAAAKTETEVAREGKNVTFYRLAFIKSDGASKEEVPQDRSTS